MLIVRCMFLQFLIIASFFAIRFFTLFTLVIGIYGESEEVLTKARRAYDLLVTKHLPIEITLIFILVMLFWNIKNKNRSRIIGDIILAIISISIYWFLESEKVILQ